MASKKKKTTANNEVETLKKENAFLKDLLRQCGHHLIECEGEAWVCPCCGKQEPLSVEVAKFKHESWCPLYTEEADGVGERRAG